MNYIRSLPINDTPEIFGLHDNANITYAQNETFSMMASILLLQPKSSSGGGASREEVQYYAHIFFILPQAQIFSNSIYLLFFLLGC